MKRFLCITLSILCMISLFTGCGNKDSNGKTTNDTPALTEQDDDTMHLNMLFSLIGTPDIGVTELLGDGESQKYNAQGNLTKRIFSGTTLGLDIIFTVNYNDFSDVTSIDVDFPSEISEDQLAATITNLIGNPPQKDGIWHTELANISLYEEEDHYCITLSEHTGD